MGTLIFYEKPGCGGNARQQRLLRAAGIELEVRDLLATPWRAETLAPFLAGRPVADWFNRAAPAVKSGEVDPERLDAEAALALLLANPILIRRPLIRLGGQHLAGFEVAALNALLPADRQLVEPAAPLDGCVHGATQAAGCHTPREPQS